MTNKSEDSELELKGWQLIVGLCIICLIIGFACGFAYTTNHLPVFKSSETRMDYIEYYLDHFFLHVRSIVKNESTVGYGLWQYDNYHPIAREILQREVDKIGIN